MTLYAQKRYGGNYLMIRTWDGIGRPDYTPIMNITEDELDFKGGRFEKYKQGNSAKKVSMSIPYPKEEITKLFDWVGENVKDTWSVDFSDDYQNWKNSVTKNIPPRTTDLTFETFVFYFTEDDDMVKFMLRWSG